jgi:8-amino-7-oxononanoate synthase
MKGSDKIPPMHPGDGGAAGMTSEQKRALLKELMKQRAQDNVAPAPSQAMPQATVIEPDLTQHPGYRRVMGRRLLFAQMGIRSPYLKPVEGGAGPTVRVDGRECINFTSASYLDLTRHPVVCEAAKAAIDEYGVNFSASRLIGGTRSIHLELERVIADALGVPECMVFITGFQASVSVIPCLVGSKDIVLHDALIHNSFVQGSILSLARRVPFPHNDWEALDQLLAANRSAHPRALILLEGLYTMDGDMPDLPRFIQVAKRHGAWLMIDEASSIGVLGRRGFGIGEELGIDPRDVDVWMGTLAKSFPGCGGYIGGSKELLEYLRYTAPGFLYSGAVPPPIVASVLAGWRVMREEPQRLTDLRARSKLFLECARERGLDTGLSIGVGIVPVILGSSVLAVTVGNALLEEGILAGIVVSPAVEESAARLRFFINCSHTEEQIRRTVDAVARQVERHRKES